MGSKFKGKHVGGDTSVPQWAGLHNIMLTRMQWRKGISTRGQAKTVRRCRVDVQPDFCQRVGGRVQLCQDGKVADGSSSFSLISDSSIFHRM